MFPRSGHLRRFYLKIKRSSLSACKQLPKNNFTMKVGLIGFGSIGQRHYANLQKYTTDVVILSQRKDLPVAKTARTWSEFKKHGPFEIIFITNETFKHIPTLSKCLALKPKAIFMEKPLSHNLS